MKINISRTSIEISRTTLEAYRIDTDRDAGTLCFRLQYTVYGTRVAYNMVRNSDLQ